MLIIYVINNLSLGGAEVQLSLLSNEFSCRGNKVVVFTLCSKEKLDLAYRFSPNIKIVPSSDYFLMAVLKLGLFLYRQKGVYIVHSHLLKSNLVCRFWRIFRKFKLLNTSHCDYNTLGYRYAYVMYKFSKNLVDFHSAVSEESLINLKKSGSVRPSKSAVVVNGVKTDISTSSSVSGYKLNQDRLNCLVVGRLVEEKGIKELLEVWQFEHDLSIYGSGPELYALEQVVKKRNLENCVSINQPTNDVVEIMQNHDLLLLPSRSEGLPMVVLEAMSVGIPIIAMDVGQIRPLFEDSKVGRIIPRGNYSAMLDAVNYFSNISRDDKDLLKGRSQKYIEDFYSIEVVCDRWYRIYS